MTKQLTISGTKPHMELDLDSFLNSHSTSDSDSPTFLSVPHRTLDEILNDSDSDSDSDSDPSTPLPPPSPNNLTRRSSDLPPSSQNYVVSQDSTTQAQTSVNSFARAKSVDPVWRVPVPTSSSSTSRSLPSLFGGVRSNAKPGAALAAAAAASRSMVTPHAAAIKSRRASSASSGTAENVLDIVESASTVSDDHDAVSSSSNGDSSALLSIERSTSGEKLVEEDEKLVKDKDISRKDVKLEIKSEVLNTNKDVQTEAEFQVEAEHVPRVEESGIQDDHSRASSPSCTDDKDENVSLEKDNSELLDVNRSSTIEIGNGVNNEEDSAAVLLEEPAIDTNGHGDDVENDIAELVEERIGRLESEMTSKRAEKKLKPFLKPLELAEELESKQAYTGLHWEEGAAAQPMRLEGVRRGSTTLGYFDVNVNNVVTGIISSKGFRRDYGSPQALAVHVNYIAVGMSKGVIVVVPSRYSSHNVDDMDAKMLMLGLQGDRSHAAVTSICFNQQGDLLLAGYGDGHITIWDVQKASAAKVITGEHTAPVVHTFFLGQDSQFTRQFKAITGDSKGLVLLHISSVFPLLNRFSIKSQCLLDGQKTGTVLSASPLLFEESYGGALPTSQGSVSASSSGIGSMMGGVVGGEAGWKLFNEGSSLVEEGVVIFATCQTALVVRLTPTLKIYAQLSKPDGVREGSLPYTAWKCTQHSLNSSNDNIPTGAAADRVSLLAVAWDQKVQVAKLVQKELKVYGNWSLDSTAIGVAWLDDHMLVILTLTGKLLLFAKDGTLIHQTSFDVDGYGGDDLIAYHTHFTNIFGNPEKAYQNCVAVRGASVYILGPTRLIVSRLLPWKERIHVLRSAGDWMGALNMAMTLYDGHAHGVIDLPKSVDAVREAIMPYLAELLLSYVDEVFSYISVAFGNQIGKVEQQDGSKSESSSVHNEIKEQFTRVGGVAVEYCVHIQRTDILFDEVYSKFVAVQHRDTFLELLEPYILRDMLGSLPPEIMQALVEHYSAKGWLLRVEQCVLHMDISSLDFNQVVRLCREHGLYGALVYLFNKGLDDFRAPLEELLIVSRNAEKETASPLGYRMLVYLKYCFTGLAFPPGHGVLPPTRLPSLRAELVQFLLEKSDASNIQAAANLSSRPMFLNLHHLLVLDTEATLDVLRCAFVDDKNPMNDLTSHVGVSSNMDVMQESGAMDESPNLLVQNTINALVIIIEKHIFEARESTSSDDIGSGETWPSKKDVGHLFEFIAYYVSCRKACVSQSVLSQILEYLTAEVSFPPNIPTNSTEISKEREKQVLALLEAVPESDWKASHVLQLCEQADFYQVCGLIYTIRHQYLAAMDSYMKDIDEPLHTFSYINNMLEELNEKELDTFRSAVLARIPELVILSRECTFMLIVDHFNIEDPEILSKLRVNPKGLFLYLKTVIEVHSSGTLDFSYLGKDDNIESFNGRRVRDAYFEKISAFPKLMRNNPMHVTDDMVELYFELLCQYERNSVLKFLETFDSYRVEQCLRLCQEHGIIDAAAFLLERVGDVGSALLLTLSGLDDNFSELETAVESVLSKKNLNGSTNIDHFSTLLNMEEVENIRTVLHACIGLCQRNTPRLQPDESEILWFRLLDSFCEPLMDSYSDESTLKGKNYVGMLAAETLGSQGDDEALVIKWKISKSHKGAHILRKLFSVFIKDIVEGMIGYVRLPTIMSKLLSDNGSQEFGDFKITILGMLGTYGFERRILNTAKSLIEDDTFYTMSLLKKGASHGYSPRGVICCICNCPLAKNSSFRIRVFSCGHATHLDCEVLEGESSSKVHLSGCPVCMPKKNTQAARNRSAVPDNGLLNTAPNRPQRAPGNSVLHPNDDFYENTYGLQQISRFEILSNLQKDQRLVQIETMPQLRLAPPAVYHEKVKKGSDLLTGESSITKIEKPSKKQLRELKIKASALRFPLKSSIFSKEKTTKR